MEHKDSRLMPADIELVLLDMGGVLLNLRDPLTTFDLDVDQDDFMETWLLSPSVRKFECGAVSSTQFACSIVEEFALPYTPAEFLRRLESWPDAVYAGVRELLISISHGCQIALLSNTNEVHWNRDDIAGQLAPLFDETFLSYKTGHLKPDSAAFENVLIHYAVDADKILFLDDNPLNIAAAKNCGMQAQLTRGFDSLVQNLRQAGFDETLA